MTSYDDGGGRLSAGRFGSQTLLSAKALRIYTDRGLLPPRWVDPSNGYRYYAADQVATGWLIGLLRSADLSLDQIAAIVDADPDAAVRLLDQAAAALDRRNEARHTVLARARLHLRQEAGMTAVDTVLETDQPVLSVLRRMAPQQMDEVIHRELAGLRKLAAEAGLSETGDPFGVFHAPITDDSDGPLEIVLPVDGLVESEATTRIDAGDARSYRMSGGLLATRFARGRETDFPEILALYDEVHAWITDGGRIPVGPPREIWHNSPHDPEGLRLTVAWPYAAAPVDRESPPA